MREDLKAIPSHNASRVIHNVAIENHFNVVFSDDHDAEVSKFKIVPDRATVCCICYSLIKAQNGLLV